jgi:hypothetical protein
VSEPPSITARPAAVLQPAHAREQEGRRDLWRNRVFQSKFGAKNWSSKQIEFTVSSSAGMGRNLARPSNPLLGQLAPSFVYGPLSTLRRRSGERLLDVEFPFSLSADRRPSAPSVRQPQASPSADLGGGG